MTPTVTITIANNEVPVPTYQYLCTECNAPLEVVQSFSDDALTECPSCQGRLRKVYSSVGVVFKGSGFYRNDSRSTSSSSDSGASAPPATTVASSTPSETSATTSATGSSVTPAATT